MSSSALRAACPARRAAGGAVRVGPRRRSSAVRSSAAAEPAAEAEGYMSDGEQPTVIIDNQADEAATVVKVQYGNRLGLLLDTVEALRNHDLDIVRGTCETEGDSSTNIFFVTGNDGMKVTDPSRIEDMRLTIINNMLEFHPESAAKLNESPSHPKSDKPTKVRVSTSIDGSCSVVEIDTPDRAGLLIDIVKIFKDISISVFNAEIDTVGLMAKDTFRVTYKGKPLEENMATLVNNAMTFYLSDKTHDIEMDESY